MERDENKEEKIAKFYIFRNSWVSKMLEFNFIDFECFLMFLNEMLHFNGLSCSDRCLRLMLFLEPFQSHTSHEGEQFFTSDFWFICFDQGYSIDQFGT